MNYFSIQNKMFQDLPTEYTSCSLHIALERADSNKDWNAFKIIYNKDPQRLKQHLNMTSFIFDYNYNKLSENERNNLFS